MIRARDRRQYASIIQNDHSPFWWVMVKASRYSDRPGEELIDAFPIKPSRLRQVTYARIRARLAALGYRKSGPLERTDHGAVWWCRPVRMRRRAFPIAGMVWG